jgi:hypothetical protein
MQHLDEGTIHAWLDGALTPLEAEQATKHAAECATCAAAVAEARGIIAGSARIVAALDDVPGGVIPAGGKATPPASRSSAWRRLGLTPGRAALAATILLAVSTTLTLRSSSGPPSTTDSAITATAAKATAPATVPPAAPHVTAMDSIKVLARSSGNAPTLQKKSVVAPVPQTQTVADQRAVADAAAPRDTAQRDVAKPRVAAQEMVAGASAAPTSAAVTTASNNVVSAKVLQRRADSLGPANAFEGCYRVSADSASGSTEVPRGLPASFTLSRPSSELRSAPRRAFAASADSSAVRVPWRQLSTNQASVTFATAVGGAQPVSLVLTTGSPVGVASSGDRTTIVRVVRSPCPP